MSIRHSSDNKSKPLWGNLLVLVYGFVSVLVGRYYRISLEPVELEEQNGASCIVVLLTVFKQQRCKRLSVYGAIR